MLDVPLKTFCQIMRLNVSGHQCALNWCLFWCASFKEDVVLSFAITKSLISLDPFFMMEKLNRFPFFFSNWQRYVAIIEYSVLTPKRWTIRSEMTVWLYGVTGIGPCQIEFHSCFLFHLDNRIFTKLIRVCEIWRPIHVKNKDWYMFFVYQQIPTHLFK